jgi:predicted DNA-binding transcriptional regulator AlpA
MTVEPTQNNFNHPPDSFDSDRLVSPEVAAELMGLSLATLRRMWSDGEGPRKIRISKRRLGVKLRDLRDYTWRRAKSSRSPAMNDISSPSPGGLGVRHYCRNCRMKLETDRRAFCCRGCHESFYRRRCLVCEKELSKGPANRKLCKRAACRAPIDILGGGYAVAGASACTTRMKGRQARSSRVPLDELILAPGDARGRGHISYRTNLTPLAVVAVVGVPLA